MEPANDSATFIERFLSYRDEPCPKCTYNLRGIQGDTCPECGHIVQLGIVRNRPIMPRAAIWLAAIVLLLIAAQSVWSVYWYVTQFRPPSGVVFPSGFLTRIYVIEGTRLGIIGAGLIIAWLRRTRPGKGAAGRFLVVYALALVLLNSALPFVYWWW